MWHDDPLPVVFPTTVFEQLRMTFYPAVAPRAREVMFAASATTSRVADTGWPDGDSPLPDVPPDPFKWHIAVPC
jgi:hypothetical protein